LYCSKDRPTLDFCRSTDPLIWQDNPRNNPALHRTLSYLMCHRPRCSACWRSSQYNNERCTKFVFVQDPPCYFKPPVAQDLGVHEITSLAPYLFEYGTTTDPRWQLLRRQLFNTERIIKYVMYRPRPFRVDDQSVALDLGDNRINPACTATCLLRAQSHRPLQMQRRRLILPERMHQIVLSKTHPCWLKPPLLQDLVITTEITT
jgi:hypothetical protein